MRKPDEPPQSMRQVLDEEWRLAHTIFRTIDTQAAKRLYVRTSFAMVEAYAHNMRQTALLRDEEQQLKGGSPLFSPEELCVLKEVVPQVTEQGEVKPKSQWAPQAGGLLFTVRAFQRVTDSQFEVDCEIGRKELTAGIKVRNRVTHMKRPEDAHLSKADLDAVNHACGWVIINYNFLLAKPITQEEIYEWDRNEDAIPQ